MKDETVGSDLGGVADSSCTVYALHKGFWLQGEPKLAPVWRRGLKSCSQNQLCVQVWCYIHHRGHCLPLLSSEAPFPISAKASYRLVHALVWAISKLTKRSCIYQFLLAQISGVARMLTECFWRSPCPLLPLLFAFYWFFSPAFLRLSQEPSCYEKQSQLPIPFISFELH